MYFHFTLRVGPTDGDWPNSRLQRLSKTAVSYTYSLVCRWCWMPPPVWLLAPSTSTALLRFFATSSIGCQCLSEYSSRWHPPLMTVSTALGQPTSRTYARRWSTSLVGQTFVRLNAATCLCHGRGPNFADEVSTSQLQLSGTRFKLISA